jgi:hypothetical protein
VRCEQGVAILRWIDARPGALFPADAQILAIEEERNEGWIPIAWDDHTDVEIRVVTELRRGRSLWEARWLAAARDGRFRFVLTAREGIPRLASPVLQRCS